MPKTYSSIDISEAFRAIPSVDNLAGVASLDDWRKRLSPRLVVEAARRVLDDYRQALTEAGKRGKTVSLSFDQLVGRVDEALTAAQRSALPAVINATGIIIHTGLGRSPLADEAAAALSDVAARYAPVELDMASGQRGRRTDLVRDLLCELTGAESATVVNNNAAATVLVLAAVAEGREVVVSRGELVEIGGSFRLPEVMSASGAILREVGATNKTRTSDYEKAIGENTAALLKVHPSNYCIEGFTEQVSIQQLVEVGRRRDLVVIDDIGSGALVDVSRYGVSGEPAAHDSIAAGADLVLFSGDKLLGGPQAGVIVGKRKWIDRIEKHPLTRAMRLDKLILAALAATLQLHRDPDLAAKRVPVLKMLTASVESLRPRAVALAKSVGALSGVVEASIVETTAYLGGGALPNQSVPSIALRLRVKGLTEQTLADRLRNASNGATPIVARVQNDAVWLDLRTIFEDQDKQVFEAIRAAVG